MAIISKQLSCQKYIYKIHSERLRKAKWKLTLPLDEARKNDEVISLASSQVLRWIDSFNGITDLDEKSKAIKAQIRAVRREKNSAKNRNIIRTLYAELDKLQYNSDYLCLIIDKEKDYLRASKGFSVNGKNYKRLLGTNGGIKNSTIVFVSEDVCDMLREKIKNGRDVNKPIVTAKLEAYQALACSASTPVSMPNGILVVPDFETHFKSDIIYLTDEYDGEPLMEYRKDEDVTVDGCDGFGLICPELAERWSNELGLDYIISGANTRFSFEKGMEVVFPFKEFGEVVAGGNFIVKDAWGNDVDIRNVEMILTTSMVKLWDSYKSCDDYVSNCIKNGYTFGITKTCPKELENERSLNYQFIQSYDLDDDDIEELIAPTMNEIKDVLSGDWRKTVLFLRGSGLSPDKFCDLDNDFSKALMIEPRLLEDPFVQNSVYQLIKNRINEAKVGVLKVHGNYSIVCGDPYALCQSIFGLEVTGLLKAGEIYNKYWVDCGSERLACFRAPMTCHNNIKLMRPSQSDEINHWFRYLKTCTVFNCWDTTAAALNGMDYDGDLVMLTDNNILVNKLVPQPSLMCAQRRAAKVIPTEEDFIRSNIDSFGNEIGQTTNWITSMFEVQSHFEKGSREYETLSYRIKCGQQYQQNAIDKAKGIISKPMPRYWHDRHSVNKIEDDEERSFQRSIVADKKPYFMRYIYPDLMKQYNTYIRNTNCNALREFQMTVDELKSIPEDMLTDHQRDFISYFNYRMPVGVGDCVMNKICRRFEEEFDGYVGRSKKDHAFDFSILRSDAVYSPSQFKEIRKLYLEFNKRLVNYMIFSDYERVDKSESAAEVSVMQEDFSRECREICQNEDSLCNLMLDLCYSKSSTKRFAWIICGEEIINNLLRSYNYKINVPMLDENGDFVYCGEKYSVASVELGVCE